MPKHNSVTTVTPVEHTHQMPLYVLPLNVLLVSSNLSPLLFSLYMNDTEEQLLRSNCNYVTIGDKWIDDMLKILVLMYVDDTGVLVDSEAGIANAPKAMDIYFDKWKLDINCEKTKITIFSNDKCAEEITILNLRENIQNLEMNMNILVF